MNILAKEHLFLHKNNNPTKCCSNTFKLQDILSRSVPSCVRVLCTCRVNVTPELRGINMKKKTEK